MLRPFATNSLDTDLSEIGLSGGPTIGKVGACAFRYGSETASILFSRRLGTPKAKKNGCPGGYFGVASRTA